MTFLSTDLIEDTVINRPPKIRRENNAPVERKKFYHLCDRSTFNKTYLSPSLTIIYKRLKRDSISHVMLHRPQVKFEFHLFERELRARIHGCARAFPFFKFFGGFIRKWKRLWKVLLFLKFYMFHRLEQCVLSSFWCSVKWQLSFFVAGPSYCAIGITFCIGAKDTVSRVPIQ